MRNNFIKIFLLIFLLLPAISEAVSMSSSSYTTGAQVTISSVSDNYNRLTLYDLAHPDTRSCQTTMSEVTEIGGLQLTCVGSFYTFDEGNYSLIESSVQTLPCNSLSYEACKALPSFLNEATFTISSAASPSPSPTPTPGVNSISTGVISYEPAITITSPQYLQISSTTVFIQYEATDKNDKDSKEIKDRLGLGDRPVTLYYSTSGDIRRKTLIAKDLPAVGTYLWKTKGLPDLDTYYIIADVVDKAGEMGEGQVGKFAIDHSVPQFTVTTDPTQTRGEDVKISIESSKDLVDPPIVTVTQSNFVPTALDLTQDATNNKLYRGTYEVVSGYDGTAKISVTGTDKLGNVSTKIISGGTFVIGQVSVPKITPTATIPVVSPTPAPINIQPSPSPETIVIPKPVKVLQPVQPIVTAGPLSVKLLYPKEGRGVGGVAQIEWEPDAFHVDKIKNVTLSYRKGAGPYTVIASNITNQKVLWDVSSLKEGKDYELKVDAFDGKTTSEGIRKIIVDNTPPKIDVKPSMPTSSTTPFLLTASGQATDNLSGVDFIEYSVDGDHWFKASITSGQLSNKTIFNIKYPFKLEDGIYNVRYRAIDGAGNSSKPYVAKITLDENAPRIGSYSLSKGSTMLLPAAGNKFDVLVDDKLTFKISLENDTDSAEISIGGSDIPLMKKADGLWTADISFEKLGIFDILIGAKDKIGKSFSNRKIGEVEVERKGIVAPGAEVSVYIFDEGERNYVRWQGEEMGTVNPFTAGIDGKYSLILPAGKYYLKIQKDGFEKVRSDKFELESASYINLDFRLNRLSGIRSIVEPIIDKLMFYEN